MPKGKFTQSAMNINGISRDKLKERGATEFTKHTSDLLMNYFDINKDFPIIAHNVEYDRDKVLIPAFKKVDNLARLPPNDRWKCT